jgi:hypothetical protein
MRNPNKSLLRSIIATVLLLGAFFPGRVVAEETRIYLVRHAEFNKKDPEKMLTEAGRARAATLAKRLEGVQVAHVFSSHTLRARDTVAPSAEAHGLEVQQFPPLGSTVGGKVVDNRTSGKVAIKPLLKALQQVAKGSTVVVGGNSGNLYAIMAGLGVRVATKENPCGKDDMSCLPCADKSCFPKKEFNNLWLVIPAATPSGHATMSRSEYGD